MKLHDGLPEAYTIAYGELREALWSQPHRPGCPTIAATEEERGAARRCTCDRGAHARALRAMRALRPALRSASPQAPVEGRTRGLHQDLPGAYVVACTALRTALRNRLHRFGCAVPHGGTKCTCHRVSWAQALRAMRALRAPLRGAAK